MIADDALAWMTPAWNLGPAQSPRRLKKSDKDESSVRAAARAVIAVDAENKLRLDRQLLGEAFVPLSDLLTPGADE